MRSNAVSRIRLAWDQRRHWVAGALVLITGHWAGLASHEIANAVLHRETLHGEALLGGAVYVSLFILAMWWLYRERAGFFAQPRTRYLRSEPAELREHLILFLSHLDPRRGKYVNGTPEGTTLTTDLGADLDSLAALKAQGAPVWPWEMSLRGINHHLGRLKSVTMVCSPESIQQVHWFAQIVGRYVGTSGVNARVLVKGDDSAAQLAECPCDPRLDGGWEFEDFDQLSFALRQLLTQIAAQGIPEEQIIIDFTGGQKVTSVVAAAMTFNRHIKAQYVQTGEPNKVVSYDFVLEGKPSGIEL